MSLREDLNIAGRLTVHVHAADGTLVDERHATNDITIAGRELVASLFNRDKAREEIPRISRICVGGDDTPFDPKHKDLVKPVGCTDIASIEEVAVTDGANRPRRMLRLVGELGEKECNGELREAGLFTAGAGAVMYNRVVFKPINKTADFKLTLVWEITF